MCVCVSDINLKLIKDFVQYLVCFLQWRLFKINLWSKTILERINWSQLDDKMPQESGNSNSNFTSPCKNLRGLKALISQNEAPYSYTNEIINDYELGHRKAEEAGTTPLKLTLLQLYMLILTTAIKLILL